MNLRRVQKFSRFDGFWTGFVCNYARRGDHVLSKVCDGNVYSGREGSRIDEDTYLDIILMEDGVEIRGMSPVMGSLLIEPQVVNAIKVRLK